MKRKKKEQYQTPASSAGEAIERMLVEKKISSKINYDVLRDLDKTLSGGEGGGGGGGGDDEDDDDMEVDQFGMKSVLAHISEPEQSSSSYDGFIQSSLNISRIPSGSNRLPSLATRKRTFTPAINKDTLPNKLVPLHICL